MFETFTDQQIALPTGVSLRVRTAGKGPTILLLHGYPQTHVCWHRVAPRLVYDGFQVVLSDLRGYGDSSKPPTDEQHAAYSKRAMAADLSALMERLGVSRYGVAGHDRGGRVAHRLARDFPERVAAVSMLDIVPTEYMYQHADRALASTYYHWFFLIQPAPLPERMIGADADFYLRSKLMSWSGGNASAFTDAAMNEYLRCFRDEAAIHASCEDYRAAASIDLEHDRHDCGRQLEMPIQVLWGSLGAIGALYDVLEIWKTYAQAVEGKALPCRHFLPEEVPEQTATELAGFFKRTLKQ